MRTLRRLATMSRLSRRAPDERGPTFAGGRAGWSVPRTAIALAVAALLVPGVGPMAVQAQLPAEATLQGTAYVGDTLMTEGVVVLHRISDGSQGQLDSLTLDESGSFAFDLPNVPDPARSDVFFASIRHHGVLYFGAAITSAIQLDSLYEIHAYDTLLAPADGMPVALQSRSIFFEPDSAGWRVTDLFQLRNDEPRTIVSRAGGRVWSHPLPPEARNVSTGDGELAFDAATYEDGDLVVRAALPPGERLFVVRYAVDSLGLALPTGQGTEALDVLIREPAPPLTVEGLELLDRIELEPGSTYLRYSGANVTVPLVRIVPSEDASPPRVEWAAVLLAILLTGAALFILRPSRAPATAGGSGTAGGYQGVERTDLIRQVAQLDEDFEAQGSPAGSRDDYQRRREELIRRIRALDGEA